MKKETAVDFLWTKASSGEHLTPEDFEQAKAMEREQIENAWHAGVSDSDDAKSYYNDHYRATSKKYYNETYKGGQDE